jgi:hypothetical protein
MKVLLSAMFSAVLIVATPMLSQADMGGHGMDDGMFQQAFDDYNHQFQMSFGNEAEQPLQNELGHVIGMMLLAFGGQFEIHHPDSDQKILVTIPSDAPMHWFQMESVQDEDMAEFDPATNILTVHHLRLGDQVQRNINLRMHVNEDGMWEILD